MATAVKATRKTYHVDLTVTSHVTESLDYEVDAVSEDEAISEAKHLAMWDAEGEDPEVDVYHVECLTPDTDEFGQEVDEDGDPVPYKPPEEQMPLPGFGALVGRAEVMC